MDFKNILLEKKDGVGKVIINRPPLNILDIPSIEEMIQALAKLGTDDEVKVVVVTASGNKAFSAGVEVADHLGDKVYRMVEVFSQLFISLVEVDKPTIAVVNGVALGGGCELVAGCDMAVASETAKLGQPEIKLGGLAPAAAGLLSRITGEKRAFEIVLLGENMTAAEAERIGLVNRVVPEEELDSTAEGLARKFLDSSPLSIKLVRDAFYQCADAAGFDEAMQEATELGIKTWETEDGQEGLNSFLEKRPPVWRNR